MKKIAVVLSGCGHKDGTEITEAVSLLIALSNCGAEVQFFAPEIEIHPKNHLTNQVDSKGRRNVMVEAARIARGNIFPLSVLKVGDFQGLAFPGGFGVALNLCDWGLKGASCDVIEEVASIIQAFYRASKPIAAICIAPVLLAKVLGENKITLTLGDSPEVIKEVLKTGAVHEVCPVDDFITDRHHKVITTPAYMYDGAKPHQVFKGISGLAKELVEMS